MKKTDIVFNVIEQILSNSPESSYARLNPALRSVLGGCISADLPFLPDTFSRIYKELRGNWWFGDGAGSSRGEHYYSHAIGVNHTTACQSFEQFAGRPGVLWEEDAGAAARLHVGSQFSWKGYYVTVTSMRADNLVACTYHDVADNINGIKVGARLNDYSSGKHFVITSSKRTIQGWNLRVVKADPDNGSRNVAKRFTITYAEIAEYRRTEAKRVKAVIDEIVKCNQAKDARALTKRISDEHFRHFQLEKIKAAWTDRLKNASEQEKVNDRKPS